MTARAEVITDLVLSFLLLSAVCGCLSEWDRGSVDEPSVRRSTCAQISAARD
jgi:hypothetical protein